MSTLSKVTPDEQFDLVLVPVRADQLRGVLPVLIDMKDDSDVLFFGNTGNLHRNLRPSWAGVLSPGFPLRDGPGRLRRR